MKDRAILLVFAALGACGGTSAAQPDDAATSDDVGAPDDAGPADEGEAPDGACRADGGGTDATDAREAYCSPDPEDAGDAPDCPGGMTVCWGMPGYETPRCVDTSNDPAYCGCCGNVCTAPSCIDGVCDECVENPCGSWRPIPATGAMARRQAPAVWTGTEMLVWGGYDDTREPTASGDRYDPATGSWRPMSALGAPEPRAGNVAVWTGREMVVWGGVITLGSGPTPRFVGLDTGGRYDPATDTWRPTSAVGAPRGRFFHKAVWTGSEMLVWGGTDYGPDAPFGDGGRYDPATDTWRPISPTDAPSARWPSVFVWAGDELVVLGGYGPVPGGYAYPDDGGRYDPIADRWTPTSTDGAPETPFGDGVWTGTEVLVLPDPPNGPGGSRGGRYLPSEDRWLPTSAPCDRRRGYPPPVWTGSEVLVWGGVSVDPDSLPDGWPVFGASYMRSTMRWSPVTDRWTLTPAGDAPDGREEVSAVWTGTELLVWGGDGPRGDGTYGPLASGGAFRP